MASSSFGSEKKSISSQVPKSQKLMASSSLSEKSFPCQLRLVYGTWAAAEATPLLEDDETAESCLARIPSTLKKGDVLYIEVWGKEAVEKAVALTGTEVAGLKILDFNQHYLS
ncbi:unnamed protein product [Arabis nemorensis]|uniref:Uncharacterized protein n=1 Tax=Arabis nemorensis TaxID=586526 RepID=A0A565BLL3_9BRAS|nr:unnamed protein product [Arabis nemorensis]